MKTSGRVIILFGFSGSGKSTLANMIGRKTGLRVIHPSGIIRDIYEGRQVDIEKTRHNTGFWESDEGVRVFRERLEQDEPVDVRVNRILVQEVDRGELVVDSWSLPWLTEKGTKIYLAASLETRAERVAKRGGLTFERALEVVSLKDEETTKLFRRLYGFDIQKDHHVFHHVVNTEMLNEAEVFTRLEGVV